MNALFLAAFLPSLAAAQDVTVETSGTCPGDVTVAAAGLTPGGDAFLIASDTLDGSTVPAGPCAGTPMALGEVAAYKRIGVADDGTIALAAALDEPFCSRHVVALDVATCDVSAPASLQGATRDVTFRVDMGCAGIDYTTVYVTGPWADWTDAHPLTDVDGDGIWETTLPFDVDETFEYKFMVDSWAFQEDLVDDMLGGGSCAPITDYYSYANRLETASDDLVLDSTYGSCWACGDGPASVDFEVDLRCSGLDPVSVGLPGPDVGWDFYARTLTDADGDGIWTGSFEFDAGTLLEYTIALDGWAMQENLIDEMIDGAECAPVTDYYSYANRQVVIEDGMVYRQTYDSCEACDL